MKNFNIELGAFLGKRVTGIRGYASKEFGDDTPVFHVYSVDFDDGSSLSLDGEHDFAYVGLDGHEERLLELVTGEEEETP